QRRCAHTRLPLRPDKREVEPICCAHEPLEPCPLVWRWLLVPDRAVASWPCASVETRFGEEPRTSPCPSTSRIAREGRLSRRARRRRCRPSHEMFEFRAERDSSMTRSSPSPAVMSPVCLLLPGVVLDQTV